jgi:hypothetical protein
MFYWPCNLLYMFWALICPSSGARDYTFSYNMWRVVPWLLVVGGQVQCSRICVLDAYPVTLHLSADHQQPRHYTPHVVTKSIVSSSWWWAYKCPKHVEQITSSINHWVASSWFCSPHITMMHGQTHIKIIRVPVYITQLVFFLNFRTSCNKI